MLWSCTISHQVGWSGTQFAVCSKREAISVSTRSEVALVEGMRSQGQQEELTRIQTSQETQCLTTLC